MLREIIAGTGNALATDSDITPTADAQNSGTFTSLASGTYAVDVVQEDSFGNQSQVLSSNPVIITPATGLALLRSAAGSAAAQVRL